MYLLLFVSIIVFLVLTIFPRRKIKKENGLKNEYAHYHEDLYNHLKINDLNTFIEKEETSEQIVDQIKNCSRIAHLKENYLRISSILIGPFSVLLVCIIVFLFI